MKTCCQSVRIYQTSFSPFKSFRQQSSRGETWKSASFKKIFFLGGGSVAVLQMQWTVVLVLRWWWNTSVEKPASRGPIETFSPQICTKSETSQCRALCWLLTTTASCRLSSDVFHMCTMDWSLPIHKCWIFWEKLMSLKGVVEIISILCALVLSAITVVITSSHQLSAQYKLSQPQTQTPALYPPPPPSLAVICTLIQIYQNMAWPLMPQLTSCSTCFIELPVAWRHKTAFRNTCCCWFFAILNLTLDVFWFDIFICNEWQHEHEAPHGNCDISLRL